VLLEALGLILPKSVDYLDDVEAPAPAEAPPPRSAEDIRRQVNAEVARCVTTLDLSAMIREGLDLARGRV